MNRRHDAPLHRAITLVGSSIFPVAAIVNVRNPSERLRLTLKAFYEFQGTALVNYDSIVNSNTEWRIRPRDPGTGSLGQPYLADLIGLADPLRLRRLPNLFEISTGAEQIQIDITQTANVASATGSITVGNWYVRASWEPVDSTIPDGELERLFDKCGIDGRLVQQSV